MAKSPLAKYEDINCPEAQDLINRMLRKMRKDLKEREKHEKEKATEDK